MRPGPDPDAFVSRLAACVLVGALGLADTRVVLYPHKGSPNLIGVISHRTMTSLVGQFSRRRRPLRSLSSSSPWPGPEPTVLAHH